MAAELIYALATPRAPSAIAVMRAAGGDAAALLATLGVAPPPPPKRASLRRVRHPRSGEVIDQALILRFEAGSSYTGDESVEFYLHGGLAVIDAMSDALEACGARLALPGEFTRRALAAGKLDLAQAESISELISAESQAARRIALRALDGDVGRQAKAWREQLISAAGLLETGVDFVEEALGSELEDRASREIRTVCDAIHRELEGPAVSVGSEVPTAVLFGPPNAGKSTLLNAISAQDAAIVAPRPGTTRDAIAVELTVQGQPVRVVDTAGLREALDEIEAEGVRRSRNWVNKADYRILLLSSDTVMASEGDHQALEIALVDDADLVLWTKADLDPVAPASLSAAAGERLRVVSNETGEAAETLRSFLAKRLEARAASLSPISSVDRRRKLLIDAQEHLLEAVSSASNGFPELAAASLKRGARCLQALVGAVSDEDVLDQVFSRFCIGK